MLLSFNYYGFLVGIAAIVAIWLFEKRLFQLGIKFKKPSFNLFLILVMAVIGARLWHIFTDWQFYEHNFWQILALWQGGLSILGAIVGMGLGLFIVSKLEKISFLLLIDVLSLSLPFAQAIGRWGNYFNQELFGLPANLPWSILVNGQKVHPLFLYESVLMLALGIYLNKKFELEKASSGYYFFFYLFTYFVIRFLLDFLRVQKTMLNSWLGVNQAIILLLLTMMTVFGIYQKKYGKKY